MGGLSERGVLASGAGERWFVERVAFIARGARFPSLEILNLHLDGRFEIRFTLLVFASFSFVLLRCPSYSSPSHRCLVSSFDLWNRSVALQASGNERA